MLLSGRTFIARHAETVFNAAARIQGETPHTPLTRDGFAQADAMGAALTTWLGTRQALTLWTSPAGRTRQTLAIIAEHLDADYHEVHADPRLREIDMGEWSGLSFAEVEAAGGPFIDHSERLFTRAAPGGESYADVAARLSHWLAEQQGTGGDRLIVTHGMAARVLRGLMLGLPVDPRFGAPIAPSVPQGSMVMLGGDGSEEKLICTGDGTRFD